MSNRPRILALAYRESATSVCGCFSVFCGALTSFALAHCEMAAVETASVIKIMMIAASCAKLFANSFMPCPSPKPFASALLPNCLSNVYASEDREGFQREQERQITLR